MVRLALANGRRVPRTPVARAVPAVLIALAVHTLPVAGQEVGGPLPPRSQRTASWYADNPAALRIVTEACQDDPGRLRNTRDCINAAQARIIVAERQARPRAGRGVDEHTRNRGNDDHPPTSPRYWITRPEERAHRLLHCDRTKVEVMNPSGFAARICKAARG